MIDDWRKYSSTVELKQLVEEVGCLKVGHGCVRSYALTYIAEILHAARGFFACS